MKIEIKEGGMSADPELASLPSDVTCKFAANCSAPQTPVTIQFSVSKAAKVFFEIDNTLVRAFAIQETLGTDFKEIVQTRKLVFKRGKEGLRSVTITASIATQTDPSVTKQTRKLITVQ